MSDTAQTHLGSSPVQGLEYVVLGVATCFQQDQEGRLVEVLVAEPVPAADLDCLAQERRSTSYVLLYATTYAEIVNNGILKPAPQLTPADLERMLAVNLKGSFYTSQLAANPMREQKSGHILNFPGVLGRYPMAMASAYCAAKFGVVGFSKCMADELKRFGVRFTLFYFGGIDSPFWDPISLKVQRDKMLSPATAAEAICFALTAPAGAVPSEIVLQPESHQFL